MSTTAPSSSTGRSHGRAAIIGYWLLSGVIAVTAVAVSLGSAQRTAAARQCEDTVVVEVGAEMAAPLRHAAERLWSERDPRNCTAYTVVAVPPGTDGQQGPAPALWVPDSRLFRAAELQDARHAAVTWDELGVIAESPVVIAVPQGVAVPENPSWRVLVDGALPTRMVKPERSTSALLALLSGRKVLGDDVPSQQAFGGALIALAQTSLQSEADYFAASAAGTAFPISEQQLLTRAATSGPGPEAIVLREGSAFLEYPLLLNKQADPVARAAGQELLAELQTPKGREDLAEAFFRTPRGPAPAGGVDAGGRITVDAADALRALRSWQAVSVPMRTLAVVDISGSMSATHAGQSRIDQTVEASTTALSLFPGTAQVGLWEFSTNLRGAQDWRELVPIGRLEQRTGAATQRQLLQGALATLPSHLSGDTGLYDTVLAAYLRVKNGYDPASVNSVILLTDGKNEDTAGITLDQLLARLQAESEVGRPLRIVTIGISDEADMSALNRISAATGGNAFHAREPQQIRDMYVQALFDRFCRPRCE